MEAISVARSDLMSEPGSNKRGDFGNSTMSSNLSMATVDVEELRQQLSATSIELEEQKEQFKKHFSRNFKEIEECVGEITELTADEKKMRVRINQLENDLEYQLKRLDLICKTKGLQRPNRPSVLPDKPARVSGSYVSPYRMQKNTSSPAGRNLSNGSAQRRLGYSSDPMNKFTPPNARKSSNNRDTSPGGSVGTQKRTDSKPVTRYRSPGVQSDGSKGGQSPMGSQKGNRLYSPSGGLRSGSQTQSPQAYAAHQAGASRVRREPAVAGAIAANSASQSKSNSRQRAAEYAKQA